MYVSTQKLAQMFIYMSTTCCESFKSFGGVGKQFFLKCGRFHSSYRLARYRISTQITVKLPENPLGVASNQVRLIVRNLRYFKMVIK